MCKHLPRAWLIMYLESWVFTHKNGNTWYMLCDRSVFVLTHWILLKEWMFSSAWIIMFIYFCIVLTPSCSLSHLFLLCTLQTTLNLKCVVFCYFSKIHQYGRTSGQTALYCVDMESERPKLYTTNVLNINNNKHRNISLQALEQMQ